MIDRSARIRLGSTAIILACIGCAHDVTRPGLDEKPSAVLVETGVENLSQRIEFSGTELAIGDTLHIWSVVVNTGAPRSIEARICGVDIMNLTLDPYGVGCDGYSVRRELATGDSIWTEDRGVVAGEPGERQVRIRHLLDPEHWVTVDIRVSEQ